MDGMIKRAAHQAAQVTGWDTEHEAMAALEFTRFCELADAYPQERLMPSFDVDMVWHELLGRPNVPTHDTHHRADAAQCFQRTLDLYTSRFGPPGLLWASPASCQVNKPESPDTGDGAPDPTD